MRLLSDGEARATQKLLMPSMQLYRHRKRTCPSSNPADPANDPERPCLQPFFISISVGSSGIAGNWPGLGVCFGCENTLRDMASSNRPPGSPIRSRNGLPGEGSEGSCTIWDSGIGLTRSLMTMSRMAPNGRSKFIGTINTRGPMGRTRSRMTLTDWNAPFAVLRKKSMPPETRLNTCIWRQRVPIPLMTYPKTGRSPRLAMWPSWFPQAQGGICKGSVFVSDQRDCRKEHDLKRHSI